MPAWLTILLTAAGVARAVWWAARRRPNAVLKEVEARLAAANKALTVAAEQRDEASEQRNIAQARVTHALDERDAAVREHTRLLVGIQEVTREAECGVMPAVMLRSLRRLQDRHQAPEVRT